jgi:iron complex outermembrane receptor protein
MTANRYRKSLLASTLLVGAVAIANPAYAQMTTAAAEPAPETSTGEIVVTGTLVRNPNLIASTPVNVVGAEEISLRQRNTAEELLRDLPGATPSVGSAVNNGNGGAAYVDLRGLGNFRNVVLLDGARIVPSDRIGRVDLNNIPLALIERVDTLTGGAATTYGADAVSGVVNFITKQDFAGAELNTSYGITERGDGRQFRADLTVGANFDDGRGNAVLSVGYQKTNPVYQGTRRISLNNYTSTSGARGGSGTTVPSRFTTPALDALFPNPTTGAASSSVINPATGALRRYVGSTDGFNFNPFNVFQTPFERFNIYGAGHYEVADGIEVYTRGMFSKNKVNTIIAPSGIFNQLVTIPFSNPYLPTGARNQFCTANGLTAAQCTLAAGATSPTLADGTPNPNFRTFTTNVARRTTELGPRTSEYTTQMFDYKAGLKFDVSDSIKLDVSGAYGESENTQQQDGYMLISRLRTALYTSSATSCNLGSSPAVLNPLNGLTLAANGAGVTAGTGCVPVNIFGPAGSISPNQVSYLTASSQTQQKASLAQARALLSGDLPVTSPYASDPIGFALGGEYRNYNARQYADVLSQTAGELGGAGGAVPNFRGSYDVREVYGEIIAPLVADKPFFQSLTVEGGVRYSDYKVDAPGNPSYNTTTWKAGGTWEPVEGIRIRGDYQHAVRAPNIAELFAPSNTNLTNLAIDPCAGGRPSANAALAAVCLAQGAPQSTLASIPNPTSAQANSTTAGGTYLRPEKSNSYTIGVVLQPRFIPGFTLSVDYYHIKITDAISQPTVGDLISGCFGNSTGGGVTASSVGNPICALFRRNPVTGALDGDASTTQGLLFPSSNAGTILTDGIDVTANYRRDLGFAKLNLSFQGNWTNRSQFQALSPGAAIPVGYTGAGGAFPVSDPRGCVGLYSTNCGSPGSAGPSSNPGSLQPEFTWNQRTTLTFGALDVSVLWRHIGKMAAEPGVVAFAGTIGSGALAGEDVDFGHIKAFNYFDLATRISVNDNVDFTLTVTNLFDKQPPIVGGTIGNTSFNSGNTYPSTYDALGRRYTVGARVKF